MNEQLELPLNDRRQEPNPDWKDAGPEPNMLYCMLYRMDQKICDWLKLPIGSPTIWCRVQIFLGIRSKYPPYDLL